MQKIGMYFSSITSEQVDAFRQLAEQYGYLFDWYPRDMSAPENAFAECEVIIGSYPPAMLRSAKCLRWHQLASVGADRFLAPGVYANDDVIITNTEGVFGVSIAEYLLMGTLMLLRKMPQYFKNQAQKKWEIAGLAGSVYGSVVTVLGMGNVGSSYAERVKALGATVRGVKRSSAAKPPYIDELYTTEELYQAVDGADIVAVCMPLTKETSGLISREFLFSLRRGVLFLNAGRGGIVDESALCDALSCGQLGGACLDVVQTEPLPADSPLWTLPNTIITPHISGRDYDALNKDAVISVFYDNLARYLSHRPLTHLVNRARGY